LRKTVSAIMLFLLLVSTLTLAFNIKPVKAEGGTIYIRADGSIEPSTAPISTSDNIAYTLTGNITTDENFDAIVIERDNICFDGAGNSIQARTFSDSGIHLSDRRNVTIRNTKILRFTWGIYLDHSNSCTIVNNEIAEIDNCVILLTGSSNNSLSRNSITGHFLPEGYSDAEGISIIRSNDNNVSGNAIRNCGRAGIVVQESSNNRLSGNGISNSTAGPTGSYGIWVDHSSNTYVCGNNITNCTRGISLSYYSSNNDITENTVTKSSYGILCNTYSSGNRVYHNSFLENDWNVRCEDSVNVWDDGYPSGGNFWSHYVDIDNYSGSYQNETGSDGIWDHPYVIDANNQDRYPLVNPWIMLTDDFSTDSGMWRFVESVVNIDTGVKYQGSAYRDSAAEYMVLTENRNYQAGVIWLNQDIFSPFIVEFKYKSGGGTGGDGLVFMFYKQKDYSPYDGGGLGFVTPPGGATSPTAVPGYGIEFDNYYNAIFNDPSENHIALIKDHVNNHLKYANDSRTEDNQWHNAKIIVGSSSVEVYLDGEVVFTWEGTIDRTYGGLGFAATTASRNNWHVINDVKITVNPWTPTHIWPMFQHDAQHTGSSPYIGPQSGNLLWSCNLGDHSIGPPVVGAEGTIYIPHQGLVALTPDGSIKWRAASGVYRSGTVTPVIASDGIIYGGNAFSWTLGSGTGFIYALDPGGRNLWGLDINLITSLTLASDGTIYAGTGYEGEGEATLYAVNPNGTVKWKFVSAPGRGWFRDSAIGLDGSIIASIIFSPSLETPPNPTIYALDPKDGSVKWQLELPFWTDISPPTIGPDGTIYLGTPSPHLEKGVLYAISSEGTLKWTLELTDGTGMPAVASDGAIYVAGVGWLSSHESALFAIRPDGSIKWSYPVRVTSPPVIGGDGTIYFGALDDAGKNAVFALSSHGELKWKYLTDDLMNSPPCISGDGTLYIGSFDGTLYAFSPAPSENQPPTCSIELRKDEVKIDEIDVGEFFDIYVGDSTDDTGIKQVRFSSDDLQDGNPTGEWTEWYDWNTSSGDWNATTKIKRWAFATSEDKEVWAEVKDDIGQTNQSYANIFVNAKILLVPYYYQGDTQWCMPTSMSMVFKYYGQNIKSWDIAKDWGWSRDVQWWNFYEPTSGMVRTYFNSRSLVADEITIDFQAIKNCVDEEKPVILSMSGISHAVVVVGYRITKDTEMVYINDPSGALMEKFDPSAVGYLPFIAVPLNWSDITQYVGGGWSSYAIAVDGIPHPPKGSIDIIDKGVRFWHAETYGEPEVYSWLYGLDKGLTWEHAWHPLALDPKDHFQFYQYVDNHMKDEQTYGLEIEFAKYEPSVSLWIPASVIWITVPVQRHNWVSIAGRQIMDSIPLGDLLLDEYGEYMITLRLYNEAFTEKYDEVVLPSIEYAPGLMFYIDSPADLYVTDPQGLHIGVDPSTGQVVNEIPGAVYTGPGTEPQVISIPCPVDGNYTVLLIGRATGSYSLTTELITLQETTFVALDIPISANAFHEYTVDWDALSLGEEGVTVQVDSNGDGVFEHTFTCGSTLIHDEFVLQTTTTVDFDPDTLNLKSKGEWVTAYTEFPEGYDVADINVSTILLNGTIPLNVDAPVTIGDYDNDSIPDLMVKFDRAEIIAYIIANVNMTELYEKRFMTTTLTVTGYLNNGTPFQASITIKIVYIKYGRITQTF